MGIPTLPFCQVTLKAKRPVYPAYPEPLKTFGDHLRKRRLELSLRQKDVSKILGVSEASIWYWEKNLRPPSLYNVSKVNEFLGYIPYEKSPKTLGERIGNARRLFGITLKQLAFRLGIDSGTLARWEKGKGRPSAELLQIISNFFSILPSGGSKPEE